MRCELSLALCFCLLLPTLTACSEKNAGEDSSTQNTAAVQESSVETGREETDPMVYKADIPAGTKYDGMTYTVVTYPNNGGIWGDTDWSATEYNGEILNDAVYSRILEVESLLGVDIKIAYSQGESDATTLSTSVTANDNAYQLYTINIGSLLHLATSSLVQDIRYFSDQGTFAMEAPWWDQNCFRDLSIGHHNYCMTGDIGTMYKKSIGVLMFNKKILEQNRLEDPYTMMQNGTWTVDKVVELGSRISNDLNGDGKMTQEDQYGLICFRNMLPIAMLGCGVKFFTKDENDMPVNTFYNERSTEVIEKLSALMYNPKLTYSWSKYGVGEDVAFDMYQTDKALFYYGELHAVATMRDMESPFGIMPMPKYDEYQEGYHHCVNPDAGASYVIPKTNVDYERCGYIMNALGAASKNKLTPAYYDKTLQGKVSRDEASSASLDVIINSIRYDLGYLGNWGIASMLNEMAESWSADLTSRYKKIERVVNKTMEENLQKLEELLQAEQK